MSTTIRLGDTGEDVRRLQRAFARMKVLGPEKVDACSVRRRTSL